MNGLRFLVLVIVLSLAQAETLKQWIEKKKYPKELSKSIALAQLAPQLMDQIGRRHFVLILPVDSAWKGAYAQLYKEAMKNPSTAQEMIYQAAVEVPRQVKKSEDIPDDVTTLGNTPVIIDRKTSRVWFGEYGSDGTPKKKGPAITIKKVPVVVLSDVTIFSATKFHLPKV